MPALELDVPASGPDAAERFVREHLGHLVADDVVASPAFRGGQPPADAALAAFDVSGYAARRNDVLPRDRRGASRLSPYIRHGLLSLPMVWDRVAGGPRRDVEKFRDELLWQEYARHWYARLGTATRRGVRHDVTAPNTSTDPAWVWPSSMACMENTVGELHTDGWLVNQARMWLASHWTARVGARWQHGEDHFFRHLLDGSRAANRLGWQWVTGAGSAKIYGFSRWQVEKRAPGLCSSCDRREHCPIERWPEEPGLRPVDLNPRLRTDPDPAATAGPAVVERTGAPDEVWLTAESLGDSDPALATHPELPVVFVFDEPLLRMLRLSAKRLVFLTETLTEIARTRHLRMWRGDPVEALRDRHVAVTFAPVPGFRSRAAAIRPAEIHPWPWLRRPGAGPVSSFTAWRRSVRA